jgi:hypothetical protein
MSALGRGANVCSLAQNGHQAFPWRAATMGRELSVTLRRSGPLVGDELAVAMSAHPSVIGPSVQPRQTMLRYGE